MKLNSDFDKAFKKEAFIGTLASILATVAMPSVNKRVVQNTFEMSKKKSMGLPTDKETKGLFGRLAKRVYKDLDSVEKMPKGFRKSFNKFFMNEGPTAILYAPADKGRELGKSLSSAAKEAPFLRQFLADITSVDTKKATKAMGKATDIMKKVKHPKNMTRAGLIGGGLMAFLADSLISKKEGPEGPLNARSL